MEKVGKTYLGLRERLPDSAHVVQVDPKNFFYLIPKLIRDLLVYRPPFLEGMRSLFMAYAFPAVIVNGRVLHQGEILDPEALAGEIESRLTAGGAVPRP